MLFLVSTEFVPPGLPAAELEALLDRERAASQRMQRDGVIVQLWRVPGTRRAVGVWAADDEAALDAHIASLPCAAFMRVERTPVVPHPHSVRGLGIDACAREAL